MDMYKDWKVPLFIQEPFNPNCQVYYPKDKVYCGTEEFSLEELRAIRYVEKEKETKAIQKPLLDKLAFMEEKMKQQEQLLNQLINKVNDDVLPPNKAANNDAVLPPNKATNNDALTSNDQKEKSEFAKPINKAKSNIAFEDSWLAINDTANHSVNHSTLLNESTNKTNVLLQPVGLKPFTNNANASVHLPTATSFLNVSELPPPQCPTNLSTLDTGSSNGCNNIPVNVYPPSPTVNTKIAMSVMNKVWDISLSKNTNENIGTDFSEPQIGPPETEVAQPFTIFQVRTMNYLF